MFYLFFDKLHSGNVTCLSNIYVISHSAIVYVEINSSMLSSIIPFAYISFKVDTDTL